jgi:hypothetical protein
MSSPYLMAVSPDLMSLSATLWPIGTSAFETSSEAGIVMRDDTEHVGAGLQALDNDDADIVRVVMN